MTVHSPRPIIKVSPQVQIDSNVDGGIELSMEKNERVSPDSPSLPNDLKPSNGITEGFFFFSGIPGDGRCMFRSVVHGACLRAGKPFPRENVTEELADDLRTKVALNWCWSSFMRKNSLISIIHFEAVSTHMYDNIHPEHHDHGSRTSFFASCFRSKNRQLYITGRVST